MSAGSSVHGPEAGAVSPDPLFSLALRELAEGRYFKCHETLEDLWRAEPGSIREYYQGVLQIAVGCFHLVERANWVGAVNKLDAGARRLERAPDPILCAEFDAAELIRQADRLQAHLRELGPGACSEFDRTLLPHRPFTGAASPTALNRKPT